MNSCTRIKRYIEQPRNK